MIIIKEIRSKRDKKKFVDFPNRLYRKNKYYIPTFFKDELEMLSPKTNAAYQYSETKFFLAYRNKKIVGRICALINHAYNEKKNYKQMRFCRFDVIDDFEVTKLLFDQVINWAKERGFNEIIGPIGFSDLDKQGLLIEGFAEESNTITLYNHPYYIKHLEKLGFKKDIDWLEYQVLAPASMSERINRMSNIITKRYGYKLVKFKKRKDMKPYIKAGFDLINESFDHLYGTVPLNDYQIEKVLKQFVTLVNLNFLYLVTNKEDELIGLGLMVPSLNKATKKSNGRLFPFGAIRALFALRHPKVLDMYLIAVKPEYQNLGVNVLMLCEGIKSGIKYGISHAETGPELEDNINVQSLWKEFETKQHRRRRCYKLKIEE